MLGITELLAIMPGAGPRTVEAFVEPLNSAMARFAINTRIRQAAFVAQIAHESGLLSRTVENLNYSAMGLRNTFPRRFTVTESIAYARDPERIANKIYSSRMGNGDAKSGDGWRYRGRGLIQITGKTNYQLCGEALGVDLVSSPELLEARNLAALSAAWYWQSRGLNELADIGDIIKITRRINGRVNELAKRQAFYHAALKSIAA